MEEENDFLNNLKNAWLSENENADNEAFSSESFSRCPYLNELIKSYRRFNENKIAAKDFRSQLDLFSYQVKTAIESFEISYAQTKGTPRLKDISQKAYMAFKGLKEAIGKIEKQLENKEETSIPTGLKKAEEAIEKMFEAYEEFDRLSRDLSMKTCLNCGKKNTPEVKYCLNCRFEFPVIADSVQIGETELKPSKEKSRFAIPSSFLGVFNGIEKLKNNELSANEFEETVNELKSRFNNARPHLEKIIMVEINEINVNLSLKDKFTEASKILTAGIEGALPAMDELISSGKSTDTAGLSSAWKKLLKCGQLIQEAQNTFSELYAGLSIEIANIL